MLGKVRGRSGQICPRSVPRSTQICTKIYPDPYQDLPRSVPRSTQIRTKIYPDPYKDMDKTLLEQKIFCPDLRRSWPSPSGADLHQIWPNVHRIGTDSIWAGLHHYLLHNLPQDLGGGHTTNLGCVSAF
eukprot:gene21344-biopygen8641